MNPRSADVSEPPIDVSVLRRDTPGATHHIHFNNAGAALPPDAVLRRQIAHLRLEARIGGYQAARSVAEELAGVRRSIAMLVGARSDEVAFHQSATDAWNVAVVGFLQSTSPGDRVLIDDAVYGSHAITLLHQARLRGLELVPVTSDDRGRIDLMELPDLVRHPRTRLVCVTHIPTSSGLVNPIEQVGAICREHGVDLVVDACQSVGQWPVDVSRIQCSALSATGRKYLRGPRGTGFLVVRRSAFSRFIPAAPDLRAADWVGPRAFALVDSACRYESWEQGVAGLLGLGVAVELARSLGVERIRARVCALAARLRSGLRELSGVEVHDRGDILCGICTFSVAGMAADEVAQTLQERGATVSVTRLGSARLDLGPRGLTAVVRASVHAYNTESEVDAVVGMVRTIASRLPALGPAQGEV